MKTLSTLAIEENGWITKDVVDEVVHRRFREFAPFAARAREAAGTLDFLFQEFVDVCLDSASLINGDETLLTNAAVLSAKESTRYAGAIDLFAVIICLVGIYCVSCSCLTRRRS